jgi:hypothetical protein
VKRDTRHCGAHRPSLPWRSPPPAALRICLPRSSVATDTPNSCDTVVIAALSRGNNRTIAQSLNTYPNRATVSPQCPKYYRAIEAATTVTQEACCRAVAMTSSSTNLSD